MWRTRRPDPEQVRRLRQHREKSDLTPLVIHDSYLINLAAPASIIREKSIEGFQGELERALLIGADYVVAHPGNYKGLTIEQGILNVAEALVLAWRGVDPVLAKNARLTILLENTAGAGAQLGGKLEELATIRTLTAPYLDVPIGYCLDTCHCYVSGFDVANGRGLAHFLDHASETLDLDNVPVIHANDTRMKLGSHLDRHANIGEGHIGSEGFRRILNHSKLKTKTFILETPVDKPGDDLRNVRALQELACPGKETAKRKRTARRPSEFRRPLFSVLARWRIAEISACSWSSAAFAR